MIISQFYTPDDLAIRLQVTQGTIRRWTNEGRFPFATNFGSDRRPLWRYPKDEYEEWERQYCAAHRILSTDDEKVLSLCHTDAR